MVIVCDLYPVDILLSLKGEAIHFSFLAHKILFNDSKNFERERIK